ncbi:flagellar hook assembly protein FlgD [Asticcacaulis endophyticus]|uniref:Basal-body rod modification protein FlgD n=1 Tax=Asticcacaulis endophyticus TaxID=1395890 RepID=A0A918PR93_9CAUL|nr:flagellar hook assembly protein FlgD [Asticcacaulis endophyticus]GGZ19738.1 basal-body rod modification protein FlgD [Asticcacaulis endophyticus]
MATSITDYLSTQSTPTNTTAAAGSTGLASTYETFLSLLTAQIKNQDPLSPMDTTEWTNQLVQYTSVEQQLKSNEYLATIANQGGDSMTTAVNYIGKDVSAEHDTATVSASGSGTSWDYKLDGNVANTLLTVKNSNGDIVYTKSIENETQGSHSFEWDGKGSNGKAMPAGDYTLSVTAKNTAGTEINSTVMVKGTVKSAEYENGEIILTIGNNRVPFYKILSVKQAAAA